MSEGEQLRGFINGQHKSKISIAKDLGISKQTLFQYFKSLVLEKETKDKFETYFGKEIFTKGQHQSVPRQPELKDEGRLALERTLENLSFDKIRTTAIIERLLTIIEKQYGHPVLPDPGTEGTSRITKNKENAG